MARVLMGGVLMAVSALVLVVAPARAAAPRSPSGLWMTQDRRGVIQFHSCGADICGTIVGISGFPPDGHVLRDVNGTPQCHLTFIKGLHLERDDRWHGRVTNPENGRTYDAEVWVPADGILRLRGYIGLPLLGSTQLWPAFAGTVKPDCHYRGNTNTP